MNTAAAFCQSEKSGSRPSLPSSAGWLKRPTNPPTSGWATAKYAAARDPTIARAKRRRSVTTTPHSPDVAE